jgi:DNA gyrase subunit A
LGDYLPTKLQMDQGETVAAVFLCGKLEGNFIFVFENGKVAKVEAAAYATKSNRRRLTGAYSEKSPVKAIFYLPQGDQQVVLYSRDGRALIFSTAQLAAKTTRSTQGVSVLTLKKKDVLSHAALLEQTAISNPSRYRVRSLPAAGALLKQEDTEEKQITMDL